MTDEQRNDDKQLAEVSAPLPAEKQPGFMQATRDFFGNALSQVKGKDMHQMIEEFSSEMTLVAEGLSEDQTKLHELYHTMATQQTIDREELEKSIDSLADAIGAANDRIKALEGTLNQFRKETENGLNDRRKDLETGLGSVRKDLEQLEKRTEERKLKKADRSQGIIRQLTILAAVVGGSWVLVTLLNLLK